MAPLTNNGRHHIWRNPFNRHTADPAPQPPDEFLCPISHHLMHDPVSVPSGHTFERTAVQVCNDLNFTPTLPDGSTPNLAGPLVPNLSIRSMIQHWCNQHKVDPPRADYYTILTTVQSQIPKTSGFRDSDSPRNSGFRDSDSPRSSGFRDSDSQLIRNVVNNQPPPHLAVTELNFPRRGSRLYTGSVDYSSSSSYSSFAPPIVTPLPFETKPASYQTSPQTEFSANPTNFESDDDDDQLFIKLISQSPSEQEEGVITLRNLTRTDERTRSELCTPQMLSLMKPLLLSRNATIQVNAVASLVNLSLEKVNKTKIVGSGLVPPLIELLRSGFPESQEHAAGALFSLSLEEDNQTAIGVLGGLEPLLNSLRSESDRTRHDSALALYHLSLNQSNRVKLVKLGSISTLLNLLKSKNMTGRVILVLCNLALCTEGKSAMLDSNAVMILVTMLKENDFDTEATLENVVATLCAMSQGSLRFRGMAKEAGAVEVLRAVEEQAKSERARERARRVLQVMKGRGEEEEEGGGGAFGGGLGGGGAFGFGRRMFENGGGGTVSQTAAGRYRGSYGGGGGRGDLYAVNTTRF